MDEARYRAAERRLWQATGVTPSEHRVRLARTGTDVRVQEVGEGPPVVFVHGATNGGTSWAGLAARMPEFRCILLDRPGCGLSDPLPFRFADVEHLAVFADRLIVQVLDALGLERAHVVATSYGGYMAFRAVAAHPDRFDRLMELGYTIGANRVPASVRFAGAPGIRKLFGAMPINERSVRAMLRRIGLRQALDAGTFTQTDVEWYLALLRDTDTLRNEINAGPRFPVGRMDDRALLPASLLAGIRTPIYLLWGDGDPFGSADLAREFVRYLPNAELEVMPGAGHAPWIDDPDHAAAITRAFLGQ